MTVRGYGRLCIGALALALPLALLGCSGGDDGDEVTVGTGSNQAWVAGPPAERADRGLVLPLDAYAFSGDEARVVARATEAEARKCFEAYGFAAAAADPLPLAASDAAVPQRHERRYAVADADVAETYGYHPPQTRDVRREFYEAHTDEELRVLVGAGPGGEPATAEGRKVPEGGCLGQATVAMAGGDEAAQLAGEELVSAIQADAWHRSLRDPRVLDVFRAWSQCMGEAGYDYAAPMEANDDPAWQASAGTPLEIATATTDVACKQKTDLVSVWSSVEAEHQGELVALHQKELEAYRAVLDQQVSRARAALG